jgi:hypothetical protein
MKSMDGLQRTDMRLWSLHPEYLDSRGLVALWREGLLAQSVLQGGTEGYRQHPQLERFRAQDDPVGAIADYLRGVHEEATRRGYAFDAKKIGPARGAGMIALTRGQLDFEWGHLLGKLATRSPEVHARLMPVKQPRTHPLFRLVPGEIEAWEKGA